MSIRVSICCCNNPVTSRAMADTLAELLNRPYFHDVSSPIHSRFPSDDSNACSARSSAATLFSCSVSRAFNWSMILISFLASLAFFAFSCSSLHPAGSSNDLVLPPDRLVLCQAIYRPRKTPQCSQTWRAVPKLGSGPDPGDAAIRLALGRVPGDRPPAT